MTSAAGSIASSLTPAPVVYADGTKLAGATSIVAGDTYACARLAGGAVACWGQGGDFDSAVVPTNVAGECWSAVATPVVEW